MKKKLIIVAFIALTLLAVGFQFRTIRLESVVNQQLQTEEWQLLNIEKMEVGKDPVVIDITNDMETSQLMQSICSTKIRYLRKEVGVEYDDTLYTMRLASDDDFVSITVDNKDHAHINDTDTTYLVKSGADLYNELISFLAINVDYHEE